MCGWHAGVNEWVTRAGDMSRCHAQVNEQANEHVNERGIDPLAAQVTGHATIPETGRLAGRITRGKGARRAATRGPVQ
jgi:hypothetical protein